ncbi:hypothetical protein LCGC14_1176580, partial [marine sediment metagenome]
MKEAIAGKINVEIKDESGMVL